MENNKNYYYVEIVERNGEFEYTHKNVKSVPKNTDAREYLTNNYVKEFYSNFAYQENDEYYFHNGQVAISLSTLSELTSDEYHTLSRFI